MSEMHVSSRLARIPQSLCNPQIPVGPLRPPNVLKSAYLGHDVGYGSLSTKVMKDSNINVKSTRVHVFLLYLYSYYILGVPCLRFPFYVPPLYVKRS